MLGLYWTFKFNTLSKFFLLITRKNSKRTEQLGTNLTDWPDCPRRGFKELPLWLIDTNGLGSPWRNDQGVGGMRLLEGRPGSVGSPTRAGRGLLRPGSLAIAWSPDLVHRRTGFLLGGLSSSLTGHHTWEGQELGSGRMPWCLERCERSGGVVIAGSLRD